MDNEQIEYLMNLAAGVWPEETTGGCDGDAWEFELYDQGKTVKKRKLGYIYGIEFYEKLAKFLWELEQENREIL